jgi:hypothetical protein
LLAWISGAPAVPGVERDEEAKADPAAAPVPASAAGKSTPPTKHRPPLAGSPSAPRRAGNARRPGCDPPFYEDHGIRRIKEGCL